MRIECDRNNDTLEQIFTGVYGYNKPFNPMKTDLKGRVAVLTGGVGMIGFAVAKVMAQSGAIVCLWDIVNDEIGSEKVRELEELGGTAKYYKVDISNRNALDDGVNEVIKDFGKIDFLFCNAGINRGNRQPVYNFDRESFSPNIRVNLDNGTVYLTKIVLPYMIKQGGGSIVFTSSVCGSAGLRNQTGFIASRFAICALTRSLAMEYAKYGIRVNCLCPGSLPLPQNKLNFLWDTVSFDDYDSNFSNPASMVFDIPARRPAYPSDMAGIVVYFASDDSFYTTGQIVNVDGGWTAGLSVDY